MKLRNLIFLLLTVCGITTASAQSLVLRHRDGTASVVRVTDSLRLQTASGHISVISGTDTQTFNNDDILSITYRKGKSDVNRDYKTDISDVVAVINTIAGSGKEPAESGVADVNGDGKTDISDVVSVINVMAGTDNTPLPDIPAEDADYTSETGNAFYIYRNDGDFNAFLRDDADSISFRGNCQLVHTPDSTYSIPFAAIDSVSFRKPEIKYKDNVFHITDAHLPYVLSADDESVTFSSALPVGMRPAVGQVMVSDTFDEPFEDGFMGTISGIDESGQGIVVSCGEAKVTDVFDELVLVGKVVADINDNISEVPPRKKISLRKIQESGSVENIEIPGQFEFKFNDFLKVKDKIKLSCDWSLYLHWGKLYLRAVLHADHDMKVEFKIDTDLIKKWMDEKDIEPMWFPSIPLVNILGIFDLDLTFGLFLEPKVELFFKGTLPVELHQDLGFEVKWPADDMLDLVMGPVKPIIKSKASFGDLEASLGLEGTLFTGIAAKMRALIMGEKILSGTITGRFGPEIGANLSTSLSTSQMPEDLHAFYSIFKDFKITAGLKADAKAKFIVFKNEWPKEKDDSEKLPLSWKWDWEIPGWESRFFVPEFTKPALPPYHMRDALCMFTVPSRDLITKWFGYHVGLAVFDLEGNKVLENYNDDVYLFEAENKVNPSVDISQLTPGETYRCVPMLSPDLKAAPSLEFTVPKKMSVTSSSVNVDVGNTQTIYISGGWGIYRIKNSSDIASATFDTSDFSSGGGGGGGGSWGDDTPSGGGNSWGDDFSGGVVSGNGNEVFVNEKDENGIDFPVYGLPVNIEGLSAGTDTITIEDIRSGFEQKIVVVVGGEANSAITISATSLDFGSVKAGESKTMQFTVTNNSEESVTFTVGEISGNFQVTGSGKTLTLLSGGHRTFNVTFSSDQTGQDYTDEIVITNTSDNSTQTIALIATTKEGTKAYLTCPDDNHPHVIDMGEAGLWACCNVGATAPWEYGGYYAWGETEEKDYYDWDNYIHCDGSEETCHDLGSDIVSTQYDVAHVKWGGKWRMPTYNQINLLLDNCSSEWTTVNGIEGRKFFAPNGGTLFLPAAGNRWDDYTDRVGGYGYYWSSTQYPDDSTTAYHLYFSSDDTDWLRNYRRNGKSVRPIYSEQEEDDDPAVIAGLCPDTNHPHIIDMGDAGKWACCNVGASAPWEYGGYYAWGETEEKDCYNWSTYIHSDGSEETCHEIGNDIAGTQYDVAHVKWGGKWLMPSHDRQMLLLDNCSSEWTEVNGISGRKFTAPNGGTIFLPAAGYRRNGSTRLVGSDGYYWSSTQYPFNSYDACSLYFYSGSTFWDYFDRYYGLSVRPVSE